MSGMFGARGGAPVLDTDRCDVRAGLFLAEYDSGEDAGLPAAEYVAMIKELRGANRDLRTQVDELTETVEDALRKKTRQSLASVVADAPGDLGVAQEAGIERLIGVRHFIVGHVFGNDIRSCLVKLVL